MWSSLRRCTAALAVVASAVACTTPDEIRPDVREAADAPIASSTPDPSAIALASAFEDLVATVTAGRDRLEAASRASSLDAARSAGRDALAQLLVEPPVAGGAAPEGRPLFPSETEDRGTDGAEDQLTMTTAAARDAGAAGGPVLSLLRDPVAGDLGSWQRDPEGVLGMVDDAIAATGGIEALELAVQELPGVGTRAVAWAWLTTRAVTLDDATAYAERGAAHLEVVLATLDTIADEVEQLARGRTRPPDAGSGTDDGDDGS